jgi:tetratricopeptide (TPR) repeat protein
MLTNSTYSLLPEAYRALRSLFRLGLLSTLLALAGIGNAWAIAGVDFSSYELADAQEAIDEADFDEAITMLEEIISFEPEDADALNLLGFSLRSADRNTEAMEKYNEALAIDPDHQGALEYQGELFLKMGDQDSAEANLEKLTELCPDGCEAHAILQTAIEKFKDGIEVSWVRPTN